MSKKHTAKKTDANEPVVGLGMVKTAINWGVAAASIAVVSGFVYWTVNLGTRDPHDVPIIRAMVGPSRVAPADPGGEQASHQGLAVNSVQSAGGVAKPAETIILAPKPAKLAEEDQPRSKEVEVSKVAVVQNPVPEPPANKTEADLDAIEIADKVAARLAERELASIDPATIPRDKIKGTEFSPSISLRPQPRPSALATEITAIQPTSSTSLTRAAEESAIDSVPLGTRLIQLGAYDSADLAKSEWAKLLGKHEHLLEDKKRLVVEAKSGGRKFYRLRAAGFNSLDESRALCSALLAVGTPCIPVTAR